MNYSQAHRRHTRILVALVFLVFFFIGIADGSVSSFNIGLWVLIFLVLGSTLLGSYGLRKVGFKGWALVVASVVAIPGLLAGLSGHSHDPDIVELESSQGFWR